MIHLAIDTTTQYLKLAIYNTENSDLFELNEFVGRKQSEELHINLKELLNRANIKVADINNIIVNVGPGSYTSLRLGLATAKGLALPFNINVVAVNSFDLIKDLYDYKNNQAIILENGERQLYLNINDENYIIEPAELKDYLKPEQEIMGTGFDVYSECLVGYKLLEGTGVISAKNIIDYVIKHNITSTKLEPLYIKPLSYKKYEYKL